MITDKTFFVADGSTQSSIEFKVENELQQGTVNSPILFNIFNSDLHKLFDLNTTNKRSIAFADDLVIYVADRDTKTIEPELQDIFEKIVHYCNAWRMKVNLQKCQTILFRQNLCKISTAERRKGKNFQIREKKNEGTVIPHKEVVKYLGVHIDQTLNYNNHIRIQIEKARKIFWQHKGLFYSNHFKKKAKFFATKH
jgi:hypothetical protein